MRAKYPGFFLRRLISFCCLPCICLSITQQAAADPDAAFCSTIAPQDGHLALQEITCMTDAELKTFRGGFIQDNQLVIGFGFERIVRVDGEIQEHVLAGLPSLNLTDNIQLVPVNRSIDSVGSRFILEDIGVRNVVSERALSEDSSISGSTPQMQLVPSTSALQDIMNNVIQNELDNKIIDQIRVVNIDVMGLGSTPRFDPQTDMNPALFESLGL